MRVIITGAAGGIGRVTAQALVAEGLDLLATDIDATRLRGTAEELRQAGASVVEVAGDLADPSFCHHVVRAAEEAFGGLDALISNAGIVGHQPLLELDVDEWDRTFAVNARATWLLARSAFPLLRETRGAVVATASIAGRHPSSPHGAYSASKAALLMLVRQLAQDWGPYGIRVNAVSPGMVVTNMSAEYYADAAQRKQREERIPLRAVAEASDIASVIAFVVSGGAGYITGQDILVDGGLDTRLMAAVRGDDLIA